MAAVEGARSAEGITVGVVPSLLDLLDLDLGEVAGIGEVIRRRRLVLEDGGDGLGQILVEIAIGGTGESRLLVASRRLREEEEAGATDGAEGIAIGSPVRGHGLVPGLRREGGDRSRLVVNVLRCFLCMFV